MAMLEVKDINVYYGLIHALRDVSFEVNEGEVVALIGANGAGKTTTLHTITGLLPSKGGTVTFEGKDITKKPGHEIVRLGMSHVPEGRRVFAGLTVRETCAWAPTPVPRARSRIRSPRCTSASRVWRSAKTSPRARCPAASSRCLPWAVR